MYINEKRLKKAMGDHLTNEKRLQEQEERRNAVRNCLIEMCVELLAKQSPNRNHDDIQLSARDLANDIMAKATDDDVLEMTKAKPKAKPKAKA